MKTFLTAMLLAAAPAVLLAQTATPDAAAKKAVKAPASKAAAKESPAAVRRSALKAVEEGTPVDEDPNVQLTDSDLEIAKKVYVGLIPCELGASVTITPSTSRPGFFAVHTKGARFSMHPVEARTGAVRLEDPRRGAIWIQLGNKSMLMSQKLGQRLADECMSPAQMTMADELKKNPIPGLLDAPAKPAASASSAAAAPSAAVAVSAPPSPAAATPAAPAVLAAPAQ
jgi:Ni/Co efflux regulator RcnB